MHLRCGRAALAAAHGRAAAHRLLARGCPIPGDAGAATQGEVAAPLACGDLLLLKLGILLVPAVGQGARASSPSPARALAAMPFWRPPLWPDASSSSYSGVVDLETPPGGQRPHRGGGGGRPLLSGGLELWRLRPATPPRRGSPLFAHHIVGGGALTALDNGGNNAGSSSNAASEQGHEGGVGRTCPAASASPSIFSLRQEYRAGFPPLPAIFLPCLIRDSDMRAPRVRTDEKRGRSCPYFKEGLTRGEGIQLVCDAIRGGIFNDLGSGSNVDVCVITKGKTEYLRNHQSPNPRTYVSSKGYSFTKGQTEVLSTKITQLKQKVEVTEGGDAMEE